LILAGDARPVEGSLGEAYEPLTPTKGNENARLDLVWQVVDQRLGPLILALERLIPDESSPRP
jgi:hypothetical protein